MVCSVGNPVPYRERQGVTFPILAIVPAVDPGRAPIFRLRLVLGTRGIYLYRWVFVSNFEEPLDIRSRSGSVLGSFRRWLRVQEQLNLSVPCATGPKGDDR
jgi:hypothetical protein